MAGAFAQVSLDDAEARRALGKLIERLTDPEPALREVGEVLLTSTKERFTAQAGPDGTRWAPNAEVTLLRYLQRRSGSFKKKGGLSKRGSERRGNKKVLIDLGDLRDTIDYQLEDGGRAVAVGSPLVYAAMQQFGGTKSEFGNLWGDIPARPFLGLSSADSDAATDILRRYLERAA